MIKLKLGENIKCTNEEYHSDREYQSSSGLKLLLHDDVKYFQKYKQPQQGDEKKKSSTYEFGTLIHTLLLEPENLFKDYAFWPRPQRQGKKFEEFKSRHKRKMVLTTKVLFRAKKMVRKLQKRSIIRKILSGGKSEVTACQIIDGVKCKARFDYINVKRGQIIDIKTTRWTRGPISNKRKHRESPGPLQFTTWDAQKYKYWMSAALYISIAEITYKRKFDFYILALGKQDHSFHLHSTRFSKLEIEQGYKQLSISLKKYREIFEENVEGYREIYKILAS